MRFLIAVVLIWTIGRGALLMGWQPASNANPLPPMTASGAPAPPSHGHAPDVALLATRPVTPVLLKAVLSRAILNLAPVGSGSKFAEQVPSVRLANLSEQETRAYQRSDGSAEASILPLAPHVGASRLSGSVWAFVRGGGRATALSPVGQIGGGQAGARIFYRLDDAGRLAATARLSTTIGGIRQSEASVGLDWKPIVTLPVHLMVERRVAIDHGGRNAWTAGAAGGVYALPIATGWRLDGYGEAGVVGTRRRDLYADGAVRVGRMLDFGNGRSLTLGGGAWGAAQPGATRLDIGPSAVLRVPVADKTIAVSLDWRERIAGGAKPGSGIALTVAADF